MFSTASSASPSSAVFPSRDTGQECIAPELLEHNGRWFVISPYITAENGVQQPFLPNEGPCRGKDGLPCKIVSHHFRDRKTGPRHPLQVARCKAHGAPAFTVYPPGFFPYGRQPLAPKAPDGSPVTGDDRTDRFEGTCFQAALDAAQGQYWPATAHSDQPSCPPRITQVRQIEHAASLLSIQPGLEETRRESAMHTLGVEGQVLRDSATLAANAQNLQDQGKAVVMVLREMPADSTCFERLACSGATANFWPPPHVWNPFTTTLRKVTFPRDGIRASPP